MSTKSTIYDIKHLSIKHYLSKLGMQPDRIQHSKAWYRSSIGRSEEEKTASLVVDLVKNRFTDYGSGANGDIIDLVCALHRVNTATALEMLSNNAVSSFKGKEFVNEQPKGFEVQTIQPIQNKSLIQYLSQRKIPLHIAKLYCSEVHYKTKGKVYFAIGFENDKKGWELRNSLFKGCISPKTVTTIKGPGAGLNIFEGFSDFLSCLAYYKTNKLTNTSIILNSVSNYRIIEDKVKDYEPLNLFLDNDQAGEKLTIKIMETNASAKNVSSSLYPNHKDFNHFLTNKLF